MEPYTLANSIDTSLSLIFFAIIENDGGTCSNCSIIFRLKSESGNVLEYCSINLRSLLMKSNVRKKRPVNLPCVTN